MDKAKKRKASVRTLKVMMFMALVLAFSFMYSGKAQADGPSGTFSFMIGNDLVQDGGSIDYSLYNVADSTLTIILRNTEGIDTGTKFKWVVSNENIIKVRPTDDYTVTLDIISPGYSGLSVTMTTPDGKTYPAVAYCDIYVPLQWSDNVSTSEPIMNNIMATSANGNYGLLYAQAGDSVATTGNPHGIYSLQLFTSDSADRPASQPDGSHYLRKLKYVKYSYKDGRLDANGNPYVSVESDIDKDELGAFTAALEWSSSNSDVAEVDSLTGFITAKSAGFATITVKTSTINEKLDKGDELSFDVIVAPSAIVSGYTTASKCEDTIEDFENSSIVFQTNALYADTLEWRVFKGDVISASSDITSKIKDDIVPSDANGRTVINNLKAGVYYVTATPKKDTKEAATTTPTYDVTTTNVSCLKYIVIVPVIFPPDSITLSYYTSTLYDSYDLLANSNLPEGVFKFSSDNIQIAKVGQNDGMVDAVGDGNTVVRITINDQNEFDRRYGSYASDSTKTKFDKVNDREKQVNVAVYNGIAINTSSATMTLGSTMQLALTAPSPYTGTIFWSSDDTNIASVDDAGMVTANRIGETTINVMINVGSGTTKRAQCLVKVVASVNKITLSSKSDYVNIDENLTISATISPTIPNASLLWSVSDAQKAEIKSSSALSVTITGKSAGQVVVTAVNPENGLVETKIITVNSEITGITLSDSNVVLRKNAGTYQLYAECTPKLPENQKLTWSSTDTKVVTVDQKGMVSIVNPGSATINVITENGKMASCKFTILQDMEEIVLDDTSLVMYVGDTHRLTYTIKPTTTSNTTLKWSTSDSKVAAVDNTGFISAKNAGSCIITAEAQDGSGARATCSITVLRNAEKIVVDVTQLNLNVGDSYQLEVTLNPADATDTISYKSSDEKKATVSANGKIIAKAKGFCIISIKTESGAASDVYVTVNQQVEGIELDKKKADLYVGETLELTATISPAGASDKEVVWESDNTSCATVDENGVVTGVGKGSALITCTTLDGDYMDYCVVSVTEKVLTLTLEVESVKVGVGKKYKLVAYINGEEVAGNTLKWSTSSKAKCTVSKSGVLKGKKAGKCTITVKTKDGSKLSAKCSVRVYTATKEIDLNKSYVDLIQGKTVKLKATTSPKTVTYSVKWESSDENVAIVSKKGKVTALKPGECVIRCVAGDDSDVYAVCRVRVTAPVSITSFNFAEDSLVMIAGETKNIEYTVSPYNYTENFNWSSGNPVVATVDSKGKVTARSVGCTTITALSDSGKKNTIDVYVVGLSKTKITLHQYESTKINLQLDGVKTGALDIRWDTDNQSIAEISNGKVTGKALGTTTVYCVVNGRYLACTVKVIKNN